MFLKMTVMEIDIVSFQNNSTRNGYGLSKRFTFPCLFNLSIFDDILRMVRQGLSLQYIRLTPLLKHLEINIIVILPRTELTQKRSQVFDTFFCSFIII